MKTWQKVVIGLVIVGVLWYAYTNGLFGTVQPIPNQPPVNPNQLDNGGTGWTGANAPSPTISTGSTIVSGGTGPITPVIDPGTGQPAIDAAGQPIVTNLPQTRGSFNAGATAIINAINATKGAVTPTPATSSPSLTSTVHPSTNFSTALGIHQSVTNGLVH